MGRVVKRKAIEWCATAIGTYGRGYGYTRGSMCFYRKKQAERYARVMNKKGDPHYITKRQVVREIVVKTATDRSQDDLIRSYRAHLGGLRKRRKRSKR